MIGNKYKKYYRIVKKDRKFFELLLCKIKSSNIQKEKLQLAKLALNFAVKYNTGYYTSSVIEKTYKEYAETISVDLTDMRYQENSFLHVLTEGYNAGGHTRVIERWIEYAPKNQKHSIVILNHNDVNLKDLEKLSAEKHGSVIYFENTLPQKEKAIKLRRLGMQYQYVILHTHMNDETALIAFGTEQFTRPVLFYNHASHLFWIGKSISDLLLDLKENDEVTTEYRNIKNRFYLGIPAKEINFKTFDKTEIKTQLNIPLNKKIIITAGSDYKYKPVCKDNYFDVLLKLADKNTYIYVIGADIKNRMWKTLHKKNKKHIIFLKYIDFDKDYLKYIASADLYLDSYPMNGWTALIDAVSVNVPVLSLKSVQPQMDYLTKTNACCETKDELLEKAQKILSDKNYADIQINAVKKSLFEHHSKEVWNFKIEQILKKVPQKHSVIDLSKETDCAYINDLAVINNPHAKQKEPFLFNKKDIKNYLKYGLIYKKQGIKYVFEILSFRKDNTKTKIFKLFGIEIIKNTKCAKNEVNRG